MEMVWPVKVDRTVTGLGGRPVCWYVPGAIAGIPEIGEIGDTELDLEVTDGSILCEV